MSTPIRSVHSRSRFAERRLERLHEVANEAAAYVSATTPRSDLEAWALATADADAHIPAVRPNVDNPENVDSIFGCGHSDRAA